MAINPQETKNKLFGGLKKEPIIIHPEQPSEKDNNLKEVDRQKETIIVPESELPKWQSLDKVTTLLTPEQKEGLDRIARKIMKFRSKQLKGVDTKERITANTVIRALVENLLEREELLQMEVLSDENDVHAWIRKVFK